jgi:branched-chain amino acid aminotransferase
MKIKTQISSSLKPLPFLDPQLNLGFGQYFSDHWFCSEFASSATGKISEGEWRNLRVEPYGRLSLDPAASVLHYGQALFEGMKAFRRKDSSIWLFRPDYNWQRMCTGAERLCMVGPSREVFMEGLKALVTIDARWVPQQPGQSLYIRPTLVGSEGFLGVRPSRETTFFIILSPVGSYYSDAAQGVKIWVEDSAVRAAPGGLGATKAGANYAASLQAALRAKERGYSQVMWLDVHHEAIEEVGTMNVFFVFKDEIVTPMLSDTILAGGVRDSVLQILRDWKLPIVERRITMKEVLQRSQNGDLLEAFGAGTAAVISPIAELFYQDQNLVLPTETPTQGSGLRAPGNSSLLGLSKQLLNHLQGIQHGDIPDRFGWMKRLEDLV